MKVQANLNSRTSIIPYSNQVMFDLSKIYLLNLKPCMRIRKLNFFFSRKFECFDTHRYLEHNKIDGMDSRFALIHKKAQEQKLLKN